MPMQAATIPYSQRTASTMSYRPSLQLQTTAINTVPYKQVTYRPQIRTKMIQRPIQMRRMKVPMPARTIAPVAPMPVTIPNVQSYKPAQQLTLPAPVSVPQVVNRPPVANVSNIQTVPLRPVVPQVPITTNTIKPVQAPIARPVPVPVPTTTIRPVQVPIARPMPVQTTLATPVQVPVARPVVPIQTSTVRPVQVPVTRPPVAVVTPVNVAPNLMRTNVAPMQPMAQPIMKPIYSPATYRPTVRRNAPIMYNRFPGYRPVNAPIQNMGVSQGYNTRTYRPRRL